ncbi:D-ribose pyranase [Actinopolyspora halophila]|uniref:D-ribose pyranase n=1 Tax=Actinopolyspora halophila TaxID=1850 RepID=UPI00037F9DAF|nr:D-ribose pyranase [Actinopolyspora halophila]
MKRTGILNAELAAHCAALGHTDRVAVVDCGLPIQADVPTVDLALVHGTPTFEATLAALLDELVVEAHTYAAESESETRQQLLSAEAGRLGPGRSVPHQDLKSLVGECAFAVRTGEATPYANVVLHCGVAFGR